MLRRFRAGEREAFEWLVRKYRQPAVGFAYHLTGDYYMAEDLAQECFAVVLVYPEKYDFRASFKTYLFTILRRKCIDDLRRRGRVLTSTYTAGVADCSEDCAAALRRRGAAPEAADNPEMLAVIREQDREWAGRLQALKPDYRMAVYLVDVSQLKYAQAAAIMQRSTVSFKVLLHRARRKLRQIYEQEEWEGELRRTGAGISG
ncbi:RNA polymerase sigma factor [Paenibacillus tengchongensis]|uniref:RNA polymerase sigma factor n=1 Tax=Paenibacillus tengchongensis TaxID=2608684 RepID=UPI001651FC15|nr:RNA polymerase sigma factor [Paenibacillus tengchongensis]